MDSMNWYERFPQGTKDKVAMNLVDRESRDMWESRARKLLRLAKIEREHFRGVSEEWEDERDRYQEAQKKQVEITERWANTCYELDEERYLHRITKRQRDEARKERDEALELYKDEAGQKKRAVEDMLTAVKTSRSRLMELKKVQGLFHSTRKQRDDRRRERDEALEGIATIRSVSAMWGLYNKASDDRDEARRWAIHFRELYEQGAPMTIAGMNTRIAELKERNERLIKEIDDFKKKYEHSCLCVESKDWICGLYKLGIGSRNTRIRELRKALTTVRHSTIDVTCKYCFDNRIIIINALEEADEQKET